MEQHEGHIVSTLNWETTFDDKALGFDLQNRISQWSKFVMPGELDQVFKQACPEGMALSIHSLEIDLGEIEVKDLEAQLKKRLVSTLREKLADMLNYPESNQNVRLTEQSQASMESLRYFLINGVMPWNYNRGDLNILVADLFKQEQMGTVELLREMGSASVGVRKRIAWQFNEPNFNETIRGFEPVSYDQISCLSGEMVRLQHKEQFLRSSVADLGKEIRLWILNYLLNDRGTIFNNLAFMKDILEQMARRHNMDYSELLLLVEKAIIKPNLAFHVKGEFMTVINMLSQQHKFSMRDRFNKHQLDTTSPEEKNVNKMDLSPQELAANIIQAGYENSYSSLLALPTGIEYWFKHAKKLDDRFMDIFFGACSYSWPPKVIGLVKFFAQLPNGTLPNISQRNIRAISVAYLLVYKEKIDQKVFFNYFLEHCAKTTGKGRNEVYNELCEVLVAMHLQGVSLNGVYELLGTTAETGYTEYDTEPFAGIVHNLNKYCLQIRNKGADRRFLSILRYDLSILVRLDARRVLQLLRGLKNKAVLFHSVPLLNNDRLINILVETDRGAVFKAINMFRTAISSISSIAGRNEIALLQRKALRLAFKTLILYPDLPSKLFFKELTDQAELSGRFDRQYLILLRQQLGLEHLPAFSTDESRKSNNRQSHNSAVVALIYKQLQDVKMPLSAVLDLMHEYRFDDPLVSMIWNDGQLSRLLLNRFFSNGNDEVKAMIATTLGHILKATPSLNRSSVEKKIDDLFWQCFIGKGWYRHGFTGLKSNFKAAVNYHYPVVTVPDATTGVPRNQMHQAEMDPARLAPFKFVELADVLKAAIATGADTVTWSGQRISLTEILIHAAGDQMDTVKLFVRLALSDKEIIRLMRMVDLVHFLYLLNISKPALSERAGDLALIFFLFNSSASSVVEDNAMLNIYKQILLLNNQQRIWKSGRDQLLREALRVSGFKFSANDQLTGKFNIAGFKLSEDILRVFISLAPARHHLFGKLNAAGFKLPAAMRTVISSKASIQHPQNDKLNTAGLKLPADMRTVSGQPAPGWYQLTDKFNAAVSTPSDDDGTIHNAPETGKQSEKTSDAVKMLNKDVISAHQRSIAEQLLYLIITEQHIPVWFNARPLYSAAMLAEEIIHRYPDTLLNILKSERLSRQELEQLAGMLSFQRLIHILSTQNNAVKPLANEIECLYKALGQMSFGIVSGWQVQMLLYRKLLFAWKSVNWALLSVSRIWQELIWDMFVVYKISKDNFMRQAADGTNALAPGYRAALLQLATIKGPKAIESAIQLKNIPEKEKSAVNNSEQLLSEPIPVKNAGMVLLSEYVPTLFRHMKLLEGQAFLNADARLDAVHILQYAVTGLMQTSELYLPLNKVICGLLLAEPVTPGITLTTAQEELISGMILNLVGQWAVIGKTSVDGFRGNWLVRDGLLSESEDRWELVVEPRPYDILINQFPFSYSIIKYQWMDKPLHVKWKI